MPFACGQNNGITSNEVYILGSLNINFINNKKFGLLQQDIERLGLNSLQKILKSFFFNLKDKKEGLILIFSFSQKRKTDFRNLRLQDS